LNENIISIGLPVFNGEKFILKRIKNILEQNFEHFELIISDNNSNDNTKKICKEFVKRDSRIKYFCQDKNLGPVLNFQFVLNHARNTYFIWAGVDDLWHNDFLKECVNFLLKNNDFVGCIGQVESSKNIDRDISNKKIIKKIINSFRWSKYGTHDAVGTYEKRIKIYLNAASAQSIYGCFKTNQLKKSFITDISFIGVDLAIILNLLKFGNFHVIGKKLISFGNSGYSKGGIIDSTKKYNHGVIGRILPYYPFTKWCFQNIEKIIVLKNLYQLFKLNLGGILAIAYDVLLSKKLKT
jgi:glycosyltransferase involved in cell wall biosynthesis